MGGQNGIFGNIFDDTGDYASNAFPPAMDAWAQGYIGWPIERDPTTGLPIGELNKDATNTYNAWEPRSLINAVDLARTRTEEDALGFGWFSSVGWPNIDGVSIIPLLDNAKKHIEDAIEYLMEGDFTTPLADLGDDWWDTREDQAYSPDTDPTPTLVFGVGGTNKGDADPGRPDTGAIDGDGGSIAEIFRPHDNVNDITHVAEIAHWDHFDPVIVDWLDESGTINWENTNIIQFMQEFMAAVTDVDVDAIVAKYRGAIEAEYTAEAQRATSMIHLAGAANTSPAALSFWRRTEEIERQVAAFRAELLNRIYPIPDVASMFGALVSDFARQDNTKLQLNQQILQGNIARMDAYLEVAVANASNLTNGLVTDAQLGTNMDLEVWVRKLEADIRQILTALDARTRIGTISDASRIQLAQLLVTLYQNLTTVDQQRASVITELRREHQANRLKMLMWRIELAETLMNAATIPLGVPMQPPLPSQFETRVATGIQTFVNVAGTLAPSGNVPLAVIGGLVGAAATTLLPRTIGDN